MDEQLLKIVVVGDTQAGKSSILARYTQDTFTANYSATVGVEFGSRIISVLGRNVKLQIWDTSGQERFKSITRSYYRGAKGYLMVYDVTNRDTFNHLESWREEISSHAESDSKIIVVGTKTDLDRQVSIEEAQSYCSRYGLTHFDVSSASGAGVHDAFNSLAEMILSGSLIERVVDIDPYYPIDSSHNLVDIDQRIERPPQSPQEMIEQGIQQITGIISNQILPNEENQLAPNCAEFQKMMNHKPSVWKFHLGIGEFDQPKSSLTLRYKTGSEASSLGYDLGFDSNSLGFAISFKATDDADSFRLGELTAIVKGMLEPLLNTSKTTFSTNIINEFDGTKIIRLLFEVKDEALINTLREVDRVSETSKLDVDLEFSERPSRNCSPASLFMRLNVDSEFKRVFYTLGGKSIPEAMKFPTQDGQMLLSFFSAMKKVEFSMEFDSFAEFYSTVFVPTVKVMPGFEQLGWHSLAKLGLYVFEESPLGGGEEMKATFEAVYKNLEGIAGLHGIHVVLGNSSAIDIRGDNFDIFTLLPTFSEYEEGQRKYKEKQAAISAGWNTTLAEPDYSIQDLSYRCD